MSANNFYTIFHLPCFHLFKMLYLKTIITNVSSILGFLCCVSIYNCLHVRKNLYFLSNLPATFPIFYVRLSFEQLARTVSVERTDSFLAFSSFLLRVHGSKYACDLRTVWGAVFAPSLHKSHVIKVYWRTRLEERKTSDRIVLPRNTFLQLSKIAGHKISVAGSVSRKCKVFPKCFDNL